jgi:acylglycerol lipase
LGDGTVKVSPSVERLWLAHGTEDKGTSYEASKKWFDKHADKHKWTFKTYEGWSHQLHADLPDNRNVFQKDVADWILAQVEDLKPPTAKL